MKHKIRRLVNKHKYRSDLIIGTVLLIIGVVILWDILIKVIKIAIGLLFVMLGFYFYARSRNMHRVRFFRF